MKKFSTMLWDENKLYLVKRWWYLLQLDFYSVSSLKQQSMGRHVFPQGHTVLIRTNQSLLFHLNTKCLVEKQPLPWFDHIEALMHDIPTQGGYHTSHYITDWIRYHWLQHYILCPNLVINPCHIIFFICVL